MPNMRIKTQTATLYQNLRFPVPLHLRSATAIAQLHEALVHRGECWRMTDTLVHLGGLRTRRG